MNTKSKLKFGLAGIIMASVAGCICPQNDYNAQIQEMIRKGSEVPLYSAAPKQERKHLHFYVSNELEGN